MILTNQKERTRFLKFAFVGAVGAVVDFGIFNLMAGPLHVSAIWSGMTSFVAAVVSNFLWNRYWTYPDSRSKPLTHQLTQFVLVSLVGLAIRTILFSLLETSFIRFANNILPANFPFTPVTVGHNVMLAFAILIVMLWNFIANRYWTYSDVD
ncbi:MAG: GtrA family protein [Chloroflexi bacterium]|nr:GtrA family protein [Chloroflexota bacterium]